MGATLWALASVGACSSDGPSAPPYDPTAARRHDAGTQGANADGGPMVNDDVLGGTAQPPADDFVSQWATIDDPDQICAGWGHSCGLRADGTATCWGLNDVGQTDAPQDETFSTIACGAHFNCAITDDGRVVCWGEEAKGDGIPPSTGEYKEIACGQLFCCAIDVADEIRCWGAEGDNGPGTPPDLGQTAAPPGLYRGITAGAAHACAIDLVTDEVVCWGGAGPSGDCFPPRSVVCGQANPPRGEFQQVAAGFFHSCGITLGGELICWGYGSTNDDCNPLSGLDSLSVDCGQSAPRAGTFERVSAGDFHTCAIDDQFELLCQGFSGSLGSVPKGTFSQVSAGADHSCGIRRNGVTACWGTGPNGELNAPDLAGN